MKTIVITGGNRGIGYQSCMQIAQLGHTVVMICRNESSASTACQDIIAETNNNNVSYLVCDLSDTTAVKDTCHKLLQLHPSIDVLINNACDFDLSHKKPRFNSQGTEVQFATNVVAPYILSHMLVPTLQANSGKIINISSQGLVLFGNMKINFGNIDAHKGYSPAKTYYQNKLALLTMSLHMSKLYPDVAIHAIRVTNVKVDLSHYNVSKFLKWMYKQKARFSITPATMATVYTRLATEQHQHFMYDHHMKAVKANKPAYDTTAQLQLDKLLQSYLG